MDGKEEGREVLRDICSNSVPFREVECTFEIQFDQVSTISEATDLVLPYVSCCFIVQRDAVAKLSVCQQGSWITANMFDRCHVYHTEKGAADGNGSDATIPLP